jgi:predicted ATPase
MALWFLGYPSQALQEVNASLALARDLEHPYSLTVALNRAACLGQFCQESHATLQWAEAAVATAAEHGFPRHTAVGSIFRGWALAMQGQEEGIAQICQGLLAYRKLGMAMEDPYFLALLVVAHNSMGEIEKGRIALEEALSLLSSERDFFYKAELYRLQGEMLLLQAMRDEQQAEACFKHARAIAQHQQARTLELRATMSLCRLWQQQGRHHKAHRLLTDLYGWFTEGFDTVDLQQAQELLAELS